MSNPSTPTRPRHGEPPPGRERLMATKKSEETKRSNNCVCGHDMNDHWADWNGIHSCDVKGCGCTGYRMYRKLSDTKIGLSGYLIIAPEKG